MLYKKNDADVYISEFKKRFSNFAEKSPLLLSFTTSQDFVTIVNEDTNDVYEFDWNFSLPVKKFIYLIKSKIYQSYPKIIRVVTNKSAISEAEQIEMIKSGTPVDQIPQEKVTISAYQLFLVEKVIMQKNFIIVKKLECDTKFPVEYWIHKKYSIKELEDKKLYRYHMPHLTLFLKKLRIAYAKKDIKELVELGDYFHNKSKFVSELNQKTE